MGLSIVTAEEIDSPFVDLQAKEPEIERFSASTLIFLFDLREPPTAYVLLCQRALLGKDENGHDKVNSWALSWEPPGGSQELFGKIILSTAQRETEEEAKLHGLRVSHQVYRDSWIDKGVLMVRYTFPLDFRSS
jgi:8-oxo-dGTP pyrophosphatase MutT (NUDIX family)